jgi:hypothetical protein
MSIFLGFGSNYLANTIFLGFGSNYLANMNRKE